MAESTYISDKNTGLPPQNLVSVDKYTNSEISQEYFREYEELQSQVKLCKSENLNLKSELIKVLDENVSLSERLKNTLDMKLNNELNAPHDYKKKCDMITNLQKQLLLTNQEKESATEMWRMALAEIRVLEDELKMYESNKHIDNIQKQFTDAKAEYSSVIKALESKLVAVSKGESKERFRRESLEKELDQIKQENNKLTKSITDKNIKLEEALQGQCKFLEKLTSAEKKESELQNEVKTLTKLRHELEEALVQCHKTIGHITQQEEAARTKVMEAVNLVETALSEKEAVLIRETLLVQQNTQLRKALKDVIEEASMEIKKEIELVKKQYNSHMEVLLRDMKKLEVCVKEQKTNLDEASRQRAILEEELRRVNSTRITLSVPDLKKMEENVKVLYNDLRRLETDRFRLEKEKDQLLVSLQCMQERHSAENEIKMEKYVLLEKRVSELSAALRYAKHSPTQSVTEFGKQQETRTDPEALDSIRTKKDIEASNELQYHLESQLCMKDKWKEAVKNITEKYESRIQVLRSQSSLLKKENKALERELATTIQELELCKGNMNKKC